MSRDKPVRHTINDVQPLAAELRQPGEELIDEFPDRAGQMAAVVAFEHLPLGLFAVQVRTVARERDHVQPGLPLGQGGLARFAHVRRPVVEHQKALPSGFGVADIQCFEILAKAGRVLARTDDLHATTPEHFDAAEDRHSSIRASRRQRRLLTAPMPNLRQIGIGLHVRLVLMMQLVALRRGLHHFFPPQPRPPHRLPLPQDPADA